MISILTPTVYASKFCFFIWLLLSMSLVEGLPLASSWLLLCMSPAKKFAPRPLSLLPSPLVIQANRLVVSWGDWKVGHSSLLWDEAGLAENAAVPWGVCEAVASKLNESFNSLASFSFVNT